MDLDPLLSWIRDERLKMVAKVILLRKKPDEVLGLFKNIDGLVFENIMKNKDRTLLAVCLAPSYLVFWKVGWLVVGVDDDTGKLFINSFPEVEDKPVTKYGKLNIFTLEDYDIRRGLGYHIDHRGGAIDLSGLTEQAELRLRVQGDLILVACHVNDVIDFVKQALEENEAIEAYITDLFMDRVLGAVVELGFSPEVREGRRGARVRVDGIDNVKLKTPLMAHLKKYFTKVIDAEEKELELHDDKLGVARVVFEKDHIYADMRDYTIPASKLEAEAMEAYTKSARKVDLNFMVGNHRVSVKSCLPNTISFHPSIKPIYIGRDRLVISLREIYAFAGETSITITHPEHATREITFRQNTAISFTTIETNDRFIMLRNRALLRHILKEPPQSEDIEA